MAGGTTFCARAVQRLTIGAVVSMSLFLLAACGPESSPSSSASSDPRIEDYMNKILDLSRETGRPVAELAKALAGSTDPRTSREKAHPSGGQ
jgi:hypothetical protein